MKLPELNFGKYGQLFAAIVVAISAFISGTTLGFPSAAIPKIRSGAAGFTLTEDELSWMVSINSLGSFVSPIPCGYMINRVGRRNTLVLFYFLSIIAWTMLAFSTSAIPIYFARFFFGLIGGAEFTIVPIYVGEIANPRWRGSLATVGQLTLFAGALYASAIASYPYRTLVWLSSIPCFVLLVGFLLIPESPYFYLIRKNRKKAVESIEWLEGTCHPEVINSKEESVQEQLKNTAGFLEVFTSKVNFKAFAVVGFLKLAVGTSTINLLMPFSSVVLPDSFVSAQGSYTVLCCVWVVFGLISSLIIERIDRKPFLYISTVGSIIPLIVTAVWYYMRDISKADLSSTTWLPLVMLMISGAFEAAGIFNIPSVLSGELFSINIKGKACALSTMLAFLSQGLNAHFYFLICEDVGIYFIFLKIIIVYVVAIFLVFFLCPETRGQSLEQIHRMQNRIDDREVTVQDGEKPLPSTQRISS